MQYIPQPLYLHGPSIVTPEISKVEKNNLEHWLSLHTLSENVQLFHYTTLGGLQGILKNRSLWLSHVSCLNDRSEIQYGQKLINKILQEYSERETDDLVRAFLHSMMNDIDMIANNRIHHAYVACFCESGNLLSQWRSYAHKGEGYCIGFEFSAETKIVSITANLSASVTPYLRKVIYNEKMQFELVDNYVKSVISATKIALQREVFGYPKQTVPQLWLFKQLAFCLI